MGYKGVENTNTGLQTLIQIQGDGVDTDSNGMPDAKIDPSTIHIDSLGGGIEQEYEMELLSAISLVGTTLTVADDNKTITIDFAATNNNSGTTTVSIGPIGNFSPLADIVMISSILSSVSGIYQMTMMISWRGLWLCPVLEVI